MTLHDWLQAVPGAVLAIIAGLLLRALRRIYWQQVATNGHVAASTQAAAAATTATHATALDVQSLQGWARRVDAQLAAAKDDHDTLTAYGPDLEWVRQLRAELESRTRGLPD